jgi:hypothetical protein
MVGQSETLGSSHIIFITLFSAGAHRFSAIYRPLQTVQLYWAKTMFLSQTSVFFLKNSSHFTCRITPEQRWRCS